MNKNNKGNKKRHDRHQQDRGRTHVLDHLDLIVITLFYKITEPFNTGIDDLKSDYQKNRRDEKEPFQII